MLGSWQKASKGYKGQKMRSKFITRGASNRVEHSLTIDGQKQIQTPVNTKHHHTQCCENQESFRRTAGILEQSNFSHHQPSMCLCQDCNCGRHLCKMNVIKPSLTKATIYHKSFYQQKSAPGVVVVAKEYQKLKGPHLEMHTIYNQGYTGRDGDQLGRPKPKDLLETSGPSQEMSSYSAEYPGHYGGNQYIKPTDKHVRGNFPLRCKSTYSRVFQNKPIKKDEYKYRPDQLKTGYDWMGKTTYDNFFGQQNPEYFAKKVKVVEKRNEKVGNGLQFKTTYKSDFLRNSNVVCRAKIYLQTRGKNSFSESKAQFAENSDFKAIAKNYQAISTSKHSYV